MTIALYTNIVSPHQMPLARELVSIVGRENYRYVFSEPFHSDRASMGWKSESEEWIIGERETPEIARKWLAEADVLICGNRDLDLLEERSKAGRKTFYANERWFKPIGLCHAKLQIPGQIRMWHHRYRKMAQRFVSMVNNYDQLRVLPFGVWARKDFLRLGVRPDKMDLWGYFVAPSDGAVLKSRQNNRILWVGRMLDWKRVDTLIKALRLMLDKNVGGACQSASLTLVGNGPEEGRLRRLASGLPVEFISSVSIDEIRKLMKNCGIYVMPSNAQEGWGAAVNEALEEGMTVIGTYEAGASATLLLESHLFHAGDSEALSTLLRNAMLGKISATSIGDWSVRRAAKRFLEICK